MLPSARPTRSITSTARCLPSISSPAVMPRTSCGTWSRPCASAGADSECVTASLIRAMLTMHSRSTASCTRRNSSSVGSPGAPSPAASGRIRRTSCPSRLSSTAISAAAMLSRAVSSGGMRRSTIAFSESSSPSTRARSAPSPSTPSVSLILRSMSSCGTRSSTCVAPLRTKMSSTSLTRVRSSRIAAATVRISRTLGADSASAASAGAWSRVATMSSRPNDSRTAPTRGPAVELCAT